MGCGGEPASARRGRTAKRRRARGEAACDCRCGAAWSWRGKGIGCGDRSHRPCPSHGHIVSDRTLCHARLCGECAESGAAGAIDFCWREVVTDPLWITEQDVVEVISLPEAIPALEAGLALE